jgi:hypothetical protein
MQQCLVATGFPYERDDASLDTLWGYLKPVLQNCRCVRRPGSAALDMCSVAEGVFNIYYERGVHSWDIAAGCLIVQVFLLRFRAGFSLTRCAGGWWRVRFAVPEGIRHVWSSDHRWQCHSRCEAEERVEHRELKNHKARQNHAAQACSAEHRQHSGPATCAHSKVTSQSSARSFQRSRERFSKMRSTIQRPLKKPLN